MFGWIGWSRLLAILLLILLAALDRAFPLEVRGYQPETFSASHLSPVPTDGTSALPLPTDPPGSEVLMTRSRLSSSASPTPAPTALATPVESPTTALEPEAAALGIFRVTGYSDSVANGTDGRGFTRSGERTRWGVVAVDPRVVPLGSRLIIEGLEDTIFTALDTGGGVIGNWVDVWFETDQEAIEHGTQQLEVRLLVR